MKHPSPARKAGGVGGADYSGAKQTASRHRPLPSAAKGVAARLKLLSQARRLVKMKQPLLSRRRGSSTLATSAARSREGPSAARRGCVRHWFLRAGCSWGQHHRLRVPRQRRRPRSPPPIGNSGRQPCFTISLKRSTQNHRRSTSWVGRLPHLLAGVKQTSRRKAATSGFDPQRTSHLLRMGARLWALCDTPAGGHTC